MTQESLTSLTTGDFIKNKQGAVKMVCVFDHPVLNVVAINALNPEDWDLVRSRLIDTPEEKSKREEYHRKIKEQEDNKR